MPALFPGPADLLATAPVLVASGFNIVDPFQSLTGRDISEGDVDAAFAYQVGSNFVDGSVVLQAAGGDGNVAIFRLNPSRGERNVMGQFELAPALGAAPAPGGLADGWLADPVIEIVVLVSIALGRSEPDRLRCSSRPGKCRLTAAR